MNSNLSIKHRWLLGGYEVQYDLSLPSNLHKLVLFSDCFLSKVLDFSASELCNIKGADATRPLLFTSDLTPARGKDELVYIQGDMIIEATKEEPEKTSVPYHAQVTSPFSRFDSGSKIFHSIHKSITPEILATVPISKLGRTIPLHPRYFRCGLEFFSTRWLSGTFGLAPVVTECLLIEVTESTFSLRIESEICKTKEALPLEKNQSLSLLNWGLIEIFEFNLTEDYKSQSRESN